MRKPDVITVLVNRVDGGVTVLRVITAEYGPDGNGNRVQHWSVEPTPEYIDSIIAKHNWPPPLQAVSWEIVPNEVNEGVDRSFRNAWKADGKRIGFDMAKARDIHREKVRRERQKELDALDIEYLAADEDGDQPRKRAVAARKKKLRDATAHPAIDAAQTIDELKALSLEVLTA
jgi:hypothetical protein